MWRAGIAAALVWMSELAPVWRVGIAAGSLGKRRNFGLGQVEDKRKEERGREKNEIKKENSSRADEEEEEEGKKKQKRQKKMKGCRDLRFIPGATHLVVGPSGSGKTFRMCEILRWKNQLFQGGEDIKNIVFCYAAWQPCYGDLSAAMLRDNKISMHFIKKKPSSVEFVQLVKCAASRGGSIVVIDDFMSQIDEDLVDIVTVQSRHHNTSTFILFQSQFPANCLGRQISLNVKYIHVYKNPRENAQIQILACQLSPNNYKYIVQAYHKVTETPHQCLLFDLTQQMEDCLRIHSHYLPRELPIRVWMPLAEGEEQGKEKSSF